MYEGDLDPPGQVLDARTELLLTSGAVWAQVPESVWAAVDAEMRASAGTTSLDSARARKRSGAGRVARWAGGLSVAAAAVGIGGYAAGGGFAVPEPDSAFALSGAGHAASASADATLRATPSGLEIAMDVRGLAPAPEGAYYQAWLKGSEGLVTIGTFHARRGGDDIVLWSGVEDISRYDTMTVTLQREGEGPGSSGVVVLAGAIAP